MKTAIAYGVFYLFIYLLIFLFEVNFFGDLLILNVLYYKYIANITFKQFTKWCFTLWFYNFIKKFSTKKIKSKKKEMIPF